MDPSSGHYISSVKDRDGRFRTYDNDHDISDEHGFRPPRDGHVSVMEFPKPRTSSSGRIVKPRTASSSDETERRRNASKFWVYLLFYSRVEEDDELVVGSHSSSSS
jgi:hypothetical protein